jgi:hypothetical protein
MANLDEVALEGASTFLRLLVQALNVILDSGSHGGLAFHRISPFECLYDLTARIVDIAHFLLYNSDDAQSGIIFCIPEEYLPLRLAINIPTLWHAYKISKLENAYWTKVFVASYLLCWLSAKIYPLRTSPLFFAISHCLVCFAVFSDQLEAALWSWFGILVIAGLTLFISPTPPQIHPARDVDFETIIRTFLQFVCLAVLWLFQYSPISMALGVKDQDWRDSRMLMVIAVLQFDAAMVFLVVARRERWSILRFGLVSVCLVGMAYVYYIELYALTEATSILLT